MNRRKKSRVINPFITGQLSPLERYSLTLCDVTSRIRSDRLSVSVECLIGILHIPSSLVLGKREIRLSKQTTIVVSLETPVRNWVDEDVLF